MLFSIKEIEKNSKNVKLDAEFALLKLENKYFSNSTNITTQNWKLFEESFLKICRNQKKLIKLIKKKICHSFNATGTCRDDVLSADNLASPIYKTLITDSYKARHEMGYNLLR